MSHRHWVGRGTGTPKDEVKKREVCEQVTWIEFGWGSYGTLLETRNEERDECVNSYITFQGVWSRVLMGSSFHPCVLIPDRVGVSV